MSAFGRLQAALAAATNEVTVAAANLNFDFTLVKYEAPKEFRPIEGVLAPKRKHDAESGTTHVTAQRLGALFTGACPHTPNLVAAYGKRVSEISLKVTADESRDYSKSIFAAYAGVDATSIWAAATSCKAAIHAHLLACMLAEFWDATEATSIWVELVSERRQDIAKRLEQGDAIHFGLAVAAAQQDISRESLACWDASARAWIHTAKTAMLKKHTQLELILKNIDLPINDQVSVFGGVMDAWKLALETMEKLVSGMPQEVHNGAAVLGIAAWHIYPDIHFFGRDNLEIRLQDPLVAEGGFLSLGCSQSGSSSDGIRWSLCLNNLKYYGHPVQKSRTMQDSPSHVSFENFHLAAVGTILGKWKVALADINGALEVFIKLCDTITDGTNQLAVVNSTKLAAMECLHNPEAKRYLFLGMRRPTFLKESHLESHENTTAVFPEPFWGLFDVATLFRFFQGPEQRLEFLKRMAARADVDNQLVCIYDKQDSRVVPILGFEKELLSTAAYRSLKRQTRSQKHKLPSTVFRVDGAQLHMTRNRRTTTLQFWYGDAQTAIFTWSQSGLQATAPIITFEDILWCLNHDFVNGQRLFSYAWEYDSVIGAMFHLHEAKMCFDTLENVTVNVACLDKPLMDQDWTQTIEVAAEPRENEAVQWIQIIANLVAGLDLIHEAIPSNFSGISVGDSLIVPSQLLQDPFDDTNNRPLTRILGNLGRPGFVIFSSAADCMLAPLDPMSWRISNMNTFSGQSEDMLKSTSIHLSFTEWTRALDLEASIGTQAVNGLVIESIISIRDHGKWVGDVDAARALMDPIVFKMDQQKPCDHPPNSQPIVPMYAVECWDELKDCPEGLVVVKARGNWVARLAATCYLVECSRQPHSRIKRVTICPDKMCWACVRPEFPANVYIH